MKTVRLMIIAGSILLFLAGVQNAQETTRQKMAGKWRAGDKTVEIFKDGRIVLYNQATKEQTKGSYELIKEDTIRLKLGDSQAEDYRISLSESRLILTHPNGETFAEYRRVSDK